MPPRAIPLLLATCVALGACSTVGTSSIERGRTPYNEVIQGTSEQQTLLNLVRVHDGETPLFVDVTEVDALTIAQAGIMGGPTMVGALGAPGTSGAVTLSGQYSEQPTVRYQPLLGAALVAQVSSSVTAESLVQLYNSGWPLGSVFDLVVTRFTPGFDDYHGALDALMTLDRYGALVLEAKSPDRPSRPPMGGVVVNAGGAPKGDAALVVYFQRSRLRERFRDCDRLVEDNAQRRVRTTTQVAQDLWARVQDLLGQSGDRIVLTLKSGSDPRRRVSADAAPTLQTRSALGMLKNAAEGGNLIVFDTKERIDAIIARTIRADGLRPSMDLTAGCHASFYRAHGEAGPGQPVEYDNRRFTSIEGDDRPKLDARGRLQEAAFGGDRRLILVQVTAERPTDGFAAVQHAGAWYSLRADDLISKRNLSLVAQIDTIQAVPPSSQPLTPAIVVGGR